MDTGMGMFDRTRIPGLCTVSTDDNLKLQNYMHERSTDMGIGMDGIETGVSFILRLSTAGVLWWFSGLGGGAQALRADHLWASYVMSYDVASVLAAGIVGIELNYVG